ncbi:MAG: hypothetical protein ABI746_12035 [Dermatophilaceae bacterium]
MGMPSTLHLLIDEQARRTRALLPLRGKARYQLLVNGRRLAGFGCEDLPKAATLGPGCYRVRVSSTLGWAVSNTLDLELRPGENAWLSLDVDERPRLTQFVCPGGVVASSLLILKRITTPLDVADQAPHTSDG